MSESFAELIALVRQLHVDVNDARQRNPAGDLLIPVDPFPLISLLEARQDALYQIRRRTLPNKDKYQDKYTITLDKRSDLVGVSGIHLTAKNNDKLFCAHGHPLFGENLYVRPDGDRGCRECRNEASRRFKARRRAALSPDS